MENTETLSAERGARSLKRIFSWPGELLKTLQSIDARLASIEKTQNKLDRCIDGNNHRRRMCVKTGHWND